MVSLLLIISLIVHLAAGLAADTNDFCNITKPQLLPHKTFCDAFLECLPTENNNKNGILMLRWCEDGLIFSVSEQSCVIPHVGDCKTRRKIQRSKPSGPCPKMNGIFSRSSSCETFLLCQSGEPSIVICPPFLLLNKRTGRCRSPRLAPLNPSCFMEPFFPRTIGISDIMSGRSEWTMNNHERSELIFSSEDIRNNNRKNPTLDSAQRIMSAEKTTVSTNPKVISEKKNPFQPSLTPMGLESVHDHDEFDESNFMELVDPHKHIFKRSIGRQESTNEKKTFNAEEMNQTPRDTRDSEISDSSVSFFLELINWILSSLNNVSGDDEST